MGRQKGVRLRRDLQRRCHAGLAWPQLATESIRLVKGVVPFDHACWHTIDPATNILTSGVAVNLEYEPRVGLYEYAVPDVNTFAALARRRSHMGLLSRATRGHPERSPRFRDLYAPQGIAAELRAAFVVDGACWGAAALYRDQGQPDFTEQETAILGSAVRTLALGHRSALLVSAAEPIATEEGPGVLVLDAHDQIISATAAGRRRLDELADIRSRPANGLPTIIRTVAARARLALTDQLDSPDARGRVFTPSGVWLNVYGSLMESSGDVVIVIEPARSHEIAPLIVQAYGLSPRERQVLGLVIRGSSNIAVAAELHVTLSTVEDHMEHVFEKMGINSRTEIAARLFVDHYQPRLGQHVGPSGWFADLL